MGTTRGTGSATGADVLLTGNGPSSKFAKLFNGEWKGGRDKTPSAADGALLCLLAYYTGANADQMERLARRSKRKRPKWDEPRRGSTWVRIDIESAIAKVQAFTSSRTTVTQITTKDPPLWLSVSQSVEEAVLGHVPDQPPKDLERDLLGLARLLLGHLRNVADMKVWVRRWYDEAGEALATFGWRKVWATFLDVFEHAKTPAGAGKLDAIYAASLAAPLPAEAARCTKPEQQRLLALCHALDKEAQGDIFFLDCRAAAPLIGVCRMTVWRYLMRFVQDGLLVLVRKGTRKSGLANEYRWVGASQLRAAA
jgi:hypothetical protein